jgi:hypothetical protein
MSAAFAGAAVSRGVSARAAKGDVMKRLASVVLFGAALLFASIASAQDAPPMYSVFTVYIQPGGQQTYESGAAEILKAMKAAGVRNPMYARTSVEEPGAYAFAVPVASWAEFGEVNAKIEAAYALVPAAMEKILPTITSLRQEMWITREDLWYRPAKPRLQDSEVGFTRITRVYPKVGHEAALDEALKEAAALRKKHGFGSGTEVYQLAMGGEVPVYAILVSGKDAADFYAENAKELAAMGAEWQAYLQKASPHVRRAEIETAVERRDLSYTP